MHMLNEELNWSDFSGGICLVCWQWNKCWSQVFLAHYLSITLWSWTKYLSSVNFSFLSTPIRTVALPTLNVESIKDGGKRCPCSTEPASQQTPGLCGLLSAPTLGNPVSFRSTCSSSHHDGLLPCPSHVGRPSWEVRAGWTWGWVSGTSAGCASDLLQVQWTAPAEHLHKQALASGLGSLAVLLSSPMADFCTRLCLCSPGYPLK